MSAIEALRGAGVESGGRAGAAEQRGAGAGGTAERMVVVAASEAARGRVAGRSGSMRARLVLRQPHYAREGRGGAGSKGAAGAMVRPAACGLRGGLFLLHM